MEKFSAGERKGMSVGVGIVVRRQEGLVLVGERRGDASRWVDPNRLPANLYPASRALLALYKRDLA